LGRGWGGRDSRDDGPDQAPFNSAGVSHTDQNWLDSVRGRIGLAWDRQVMSYVTGGAAFTGTSASVCLTTLAQCVSESQTRTGWIGGLGVEYAIFDNISLKVEYLHADFGSGRYFGAPTPPRRDDCRDPAMSS
jgi:opacity protein-like surface antigen